MIVDQEQPRRGRPPKSQEDLGEGVQAPQQRRERRRKDGEAENAGMRLAIPDWAYEKYPKQQFKLAWITDSPGRLHQKHQEDWDAVEGVDPVPGASDKNGNPTNMILHVKWRDWVDEDKAKLETRRKEIERQAEKGHVTGMGDDRGQTLAENVSYAEASNRLR